MELDWITPQQAAERWGITDRRVQFLCTNGQIDGAVRLGRGWLIPKSSSKPADGRKKNEQKPDADKHSNKQDEIYKTGESHNK
jgi:excisionase family DNA binding protein